MNISYTGRHTDFTPQMKEYMEKRLKKIKFYFPEIMTTNIILEQERNDYVFEIKITANHDVFFAKSKDMAWDKAIDDVTDKIEAAVKKKRDKITEHHK
jgi:putative sigma-54 modulation protein